MYLKMYIFTLKRVGMQDTFLGNAGESSAALTAITTCGAVVPTEVATVCGGSQLTYICSGCSCNCG